MTMVSVWVLASSLFGVATPTSLYRSAAARPPAAQPETVPRDARATRVESINGRGQVWHETATNRAPSASHHAPFSALGR
ncbi:MAG TPA: hypothetical protein VHG72_03900 [Polyangia bacterium]|nr:hypothetical protein [Polyangia bacterium]